MPEHYPTSRELTRQTGAVAAEAGSADRIDRDAPTRDQPTVEDDDVTSSGRLTNLLCLPDGIGDVEFEVLLDTTPARPALFD